MASTSAANNNNTNNNVTFSTNLAASISATVTAPTTTVLVALTAVNSSHPTTGNIPMDSSGAGGNANDNAVSNTLQVRNGVSTQRKSMKASVTIRAEKVDMTPTLPSHGLATYLYVDCASSDSRGDWIYIGCDDGRILSSLVSGRSQRVDDVSSESNKHTSSITCFMYSKNKILCPNADGYLFSGSQDRTIKVWNPTTFMPTKVFVSTCYGHEGSILTLVDGCDGSFLSTSVDGTLRRWTPQRERNMLLHPFFECTFCVTMKDTWFAAMTVNPRGLWSCYVGDNNGSVSIYRKDKTTRDKEIYSSAPFTVQLTKFVTWEKFHRLGITMLQLSTFENYLISISFDGTCKLSDSQIGCVFFVVTNSRHALYTGVVWIPEQLNLYLVDELGSLDVYNSFQEKVIATAKVKAPKSDSHRDAILSCHKGQLVCNIQRFRSEVGKSDQFMLLFPAMNRIHGAGSNAVKQFSGELSTWRISLDNKSMAFTGHEDIVVGISVLDFYANEKFEADLDISKSAKEVGKTVDADAASAVSTSTDNGERSLCSMSSRSTSSQLSSTSRMQPNKSTKIGFGSNQINSKSLKPEHSKMDEIRFQKPSMLISKEESLFFSVSTDASIRCWGECDGLENFRFKDKSNSEITCVRVIWSLNCIATGHDNGLLSIWHADSGSRVDSKVLKSSITGLVEARNAHSQLLVGSDHNGCIAIWNLTLYRIYPSRLPTDRVFQGYHGKEEPGICSLGFHYSSRTMFSGGEDRTIRSWKIQNDIAHTTNTLHRDVICSLECTESFLLSGDESGEILLWRVLKDVGPSVMQQVNTSRTSVPSGVATASTSAVDILVSMMIKWTGVRSSDASRAICALYEVENKNLLMLQSGRVPERTHIWHISAVAKPPSTRRKTRKGNDPHDLYLRSLVLTGDISAGQLVSVDSLGSLLPPLPGLSGKSFSRNADIDDEDEEMPESEGIFKIVILVTNHNCALPVLDGKMLPRYRVFSDTHPDTDILVACPHTLLHEKLEISCAQLNLLSVVQTKPRANVDGDLPATDNSLLPTTNDPSPLVHPALPLITEEPYVSQDTNTLRKFTLRMSTPDGAPVKSLNETSQELAVVATDATAVSADADAKPEESANARMGHFAVYLGSVQGTILRFEIETPLAK
jgi:WD40 repeat protein